MLRRGLILAALVLGTGFGAAHADITTGLVGRYPLDGNAIDVSGYANNGSFVGAVAAAADRFGNPSGACEFNGLNTYVLIPNSASLSSPSTACTQAGWAYLTGVSSVGSGFNPLIMKSTDGANAFMYRMVTNPTYFGGAFNNWTTHLSASQVTPLSQWHHFVTVFNGATMKFYYDGTLLSTQAMVMTITADARPLTIGADFSGVLEIFKGRIDDVCIYNRALTDADVVQLWAGGTTGVTSGSTPPMSIGYSVPNPTGGESSVDFTLQSEQSIQLDVFDVAGRRVRSLESGTHPAGLNRSHWDGRRDDGGFAPSGVYFLRLSSREGTVTSRMVRIR